MAESNAKQRLVGVLDQKVFDPALEASEGRYGSDAEKRRLRDVQEATRRTRERYHKDYTSADEVVRQFRSDLSSDEGKEVSSQLRSLDLPTLDDVRPEFEDQARELGVIGDQAA